MESKPGDWKFGVHDEATVREKVQRIIEGPDAFWDTHLAHLGMTPREALLKDRVTLSETLDAVASGEFS